MAGEQNVEIVLTADSRSVEAAQEKILRNLDIMADKLQKVEAKSKQSSKATEDGMSAAAGQALKFVGAISGISSAIGGIMVIANQLRREYDNLVSRQKGAADTQVGFEQALAQTVRNAGGVLNGQQVKDMAIALAQGASVDPAKAAQVLGSAFSARGISNKQQAEEVKSAAEMAMKFAPELSAQDTATLAGTAIDIQKRTGMTTRQAIGLIQLTGGVARTTELKGLAENVMPGAMSMEQIGGMSMEKNAALMAALTQGIVDPEGAVSRTAGITFVRELRERLPKLKDTEERLRAIQADPKLQKAFLEGGRFGGKEFAAAEIGRGQAQASVEQLIRGEGTAAQSFREFQTVISDRAAAGQKFDEMTREVQSVTFASRLKRQFETAVQQQQILDTVGGQTSITREGLSEFLKSVGQSDLSQRVENLIFEGSTIAGRAPTDVAIDRLRKTAGSIRNPSVVTDTGGNMGFAPNTQFAPREISEQDERTASAMESLASQLESFTKELRKNTDATRDNTAVTPKPVQTPRAVPSSGLSR